MSAKLLDKLQDYFERKEEKLIEEAKVSVFARYFKLPMLRQLWFYSYIVISPFGLLAVFMIFLGTVHLWAN